VHDRPQACAQSYARLDSIVFAISSRLRNQSLAEYRLSVSVLWELVQTPLECPSNLPQGAIEIRRSLVEIPMFPTPHWT